TRWPRDWSSDVCSSDLDVVAGPAPQLYRPIRDLQHRVLGKYGLLDLQNPGLDDSQRQSIRRTAVPRRRGLPSLGIRRRAPRLLRSEERRVGKGLGWWWG